MQEKGNRLRWMRWFSVIVFVTPHPSFGSLALRTHDTFSRRRRLYDGGILYEILSLANARSRMTNARGNVPPCPLRTGRVADKVSREEG